jgi:predicted nucleic acid-binding protein
VLYVDSSALLKHYVRETGTDALNKQLTEESAHDPGVFISVIGYAEILATFARRLRENPALKRQTVRLYNQFQEDWTFTWTQVELTPGVLGFIPSSVKNHPLKGLDAIHLASALWVRDALRLGVVESVSQTLVFACSDRQLKAAALAEGLQVFDPQSES